MLARMSARPPSPKKTKAKPKAKKKKRRALPVVLRTEEIDALLSAALASVNDARTPKKQLAAWRDFAMIQTGLLAGLRVAELGDLQVPHVDLAGLTLSVVEGKGAKDRNIPIGAKLLPVLREWIGERKSGYVFHGPKGKRLTTRTFQKRLDALAIKAKLTKEIHPHLLRHAFACNALRSGADIKEVQELLGHESLQTTAFYLHTEVSRLKAVVDRL
jgi:integrase/recombinase XerC